MYQWRKLFLVGLLSLVIIFTLTVGLRHVQSQEKYPSRAIDIVAAVAPGGAMDLSARIAAGYLKNKWGVPVNVVNKPGGNSIPGINEVYQSKPDGYTMLGEAMATASSLVLVPNVPFKIMDRTFIAITFASPCVILVPSALPVRSMKDLEAEIKRDPAGFTWPSSGGVATYDIVVKQILSAIGVDISKTKPVPCQGVIPSIQLAASGNTKIVVAQPTTAVPNAQSGILRPLAVADSSRWPELPDVPTTIELGYPTVKLSSWFGISGPAKLPSHIVEIWEKAIQEMMRDPETISQIKKLGLMPFYHNSKEMREYVAKESEELKKASGLK